MEIVFLLILVLFTALILGKTELKILFDSIKETQALSIKKLQILVFSVIIIAIFVIGNINSKQLITSDNHTSAYNLSIVFICTIILYFSFIRYKYPISIVQLLTGGTIGCVLYSNLAIFNPVQSIKIVSYWFLTPLLAGIICYFFYNLLHKILFASKIHYLKIQSINRVIFILSAILFVFGIILNNEVFFVGVLYESLPEKIFLGNIGINVIYFLFFLGGIAILSGLFLIKFDSADSKEYLTMDVSFVALLPSAILLIIFSLIPVIRTPLSPSQLVIASFMGIAFAKGNKKIDWLQIRKMLFSFIVLPLLEALFVYLSLSIFHSLTSNRLNGNDISSRNIVELQAPFRFNLFLIVIIAIALISITIYTIFLYFINKKKTDEKENRWREQIQFSEYQKALTEIEKNTVQLENTNLENQLEKKQRELVTYSINIGEQRQYLDSIYKSIQKAIHSDNLEEKNEILNKELSSIRQKMTYSTEMDNIYKQAAQVHTDFSEKLNTQFPDLSAQEKRLMMLLRMGLSSKEIAPLLNISIKSVEISRYRLRKKLNLQKNTNLIQFIKNL